MPHCDGGPSTYSEGLDGPSRILLRRQLCRKMYWICRGQDGHEGLEGAKRARLCSFPRPASPTSGDSPGSGS